MSLTALPVCRGTPRLKFHGMKISARLFSLSQFVTAFGVGLSWHLFSSDVRIFSSVLVAEKNNVQTSRNGFLFSCWNVDAAIL